MEETIVNGQELVEKAEEKLMEAATNLDTAVAVTKQATVPAISQSKSYKGTNLAVGAGLVLGGGAIGFAIDHWVLPWFSEEAREERKAKKEEKKAEKKAKKEAAKSKKGKKPATRKAEKEPKKPEPEPEEDDEGIDPNDIPTDEA